MSENRKREKLIHIRVSENEYKMIVGNAKRADLQLHTYLRYVAVDPVLKMFNFEATNNHGKKLKELRCSVNGLIYIIWALEKPVPEQFRLILDLLDKTYKCENELLKTLHKERDLK